MTIKNYTYQCIINPVSHYFLGGESSFNPADGGRQNYFVRSLLLPQQTTILGTLRYALLNGFIELEGNYETPDDLIGAESFNGKNVSFGVIKKLSRIYLVSSRSTVKTPIKLEVLRKDYFKAKPGVENDLLETVVSTYSSLCNTVSRINTIVNKGFNPKDYYYGKIWTDRDRLLFLTEQDIFDRFSISGNAKNTFADQPLDGYYKQEVVKIKHGFSLAVDIDFKSRLKGDLKFICKVGGDGSLFSFALTPTEDLELQEKPYMSGFEESAYYRLVALSPLKVNSKFLDCAQGSISSLLHFRNIRTSIKTQYYSGLAKGESATTAYKGGKETLFDAGSVFYINGSRLTEAINIIQSYTAYSLIGYNQFTIEKI